MKNKERKKSKSKSKEQQASCFFNENNKKGQGLRAVKGYKSTF